MSTSLLVHDWFADLYCTVDAIECASWAVLISGFFIGTPTLLVGVLTLRIPRVFWPGQVIQCLFIAYLAALVLFP